MQQLFIAFEANIKNIFQFCSDPGCFKETITDIDLKVCCMFAKT